MRPLVSIIVLFLSSLAFAGNPAASVLPSSFGGWKQTASTALQPSAADAAVLSEYGLEQAREAVYASGGNRITVRAWRFRDATGAVGAYTFERQPGMRLEKIGRGGATADGRVIFWSGATVVEARFAHPAANEAGAMKALAAKIPQPEGAAAVTPPLFGYIPAADYVPGTVHYALGPAGYAHLGSAVPVEDIGFGVEAEALTAEYAIGPQRGTLTLIMYPTPEMAAAQLAKIRAGLHAEGTLTRRSGPLLAVLTGNLPAAKAKALLDSVRVNDVVTINRPPGGASEVVKAAHLLLGIATLIGILLLATLLLGLFLGGGRALVRKLRGKPISSVSDEEFISLHLDR
jgi:hypothetical protein